ncbi:ATP-dependent DNA helicase DinG [Thalassobacillus devorans]|uniref:ATP-dependent DNA helicase DinG n=1 Tax=Thalassobacillus devorans TaxID=279813 RepID=UPI00048AD160|nr:ATP-dependent DNA helicase DinG [Thalassobacillus devorans]
MARFTVVDLETTGNAPMKNDRIIEVGIVIWEDGEVVEEFSSLVYPEQDIPPFITNLTGITNEHVENAPLFSEIAPEIHRMFTGAYVVAHNIQFDLGFLNKELAGCGLDALDNSVIDTVELARILMPQSPGFKLGQLAEQLQIQHNDPHRALSDTKVTVDLLAHLFKKFTMLPLVTLQQLLEIEGSLKSDLRALLVDEIQRKMYSGQDSHEVEMIHGLAVKAIAPKSETEYEALDSFGDYLDQLFLSAEGLASIINDYEYREGQRTMAETVYDAFTSKEHALIEAETGTGKSLAYLIPAVYYAVTNQKKVVISTFTTQLQRQLLEKEIPQVKRLFRHPFEIALLKGKEHYISTLRFSKELKEGSRDNYDIILSKAMLLVWLTETITGDIDEIQLPSSGKYLWNRISTDQEEAEETWSKANKDSFYRKARSHAEKADIIITNHSLLCTDLTLEHSFIPDFHHLIVDEAHHLETTASKYFGLHMDYGLWQNYFNQLEALYTAKQSAWSKKMLAIAEENIPVYKQLKEDLDSLFRYLFQLVVANNKKRTDRSDVGRVQFTYQHAKIKPKQLSTIQEMIQRISFAVNHLDRGIETLNAHLEAENILTDFYNSDFIEISAFIQKLKQINRELHQYLLDDEEEEIKWLEIDAMGAHNSVYLYSEPINVAEKLKHSLFEAKDSIVLTSATLTMKHSFRYITDRLGITDLKPVQVKIPSPYPFAEQVQLMVPNDFPDIKSNQAEFIHATCEAIYSMAQITEGRMLVLFTSYDMLKKTYELLREIILPEEFMLFAQGITSGSRERLKKNFQAFDQAILLGTSSFWEGVDIPGDDLSCLMIVRLPFQPPNHPVYQARADRLKQNGKNAFMEQSLPHAVIRFKQGFGRLIRSSTDRGIVFVCDQRLIHARYGKYFLESIPEVPLEIDSTARLMEKAQKWL